MHGRNRRLPSPPQLHALLTFAVLTVLGLTLVSFLGPGPFPISSKQVVGALVAFCDSTFPNEPLLLRAIAAPGAPGLAKIKSAFNHQRLKALIDLGPQSGNRLREPLGRTLAWPRGSARWDAIARTDSTAQLVIGRLCFLYCSVVSASALGRLSDTRTAREVSISRWLISASDDQESCNSLRRRSTRPKGGRQDRRQWRARCSGMAEINALSGRTRDQRHQGSL